MLVYVLLEHQSTPDRWLRLRLLGYCVQVWQRWQRQHEDQKRLPLLVPMILGVVGRDNSERGSAGRKAALIAPVFGRLSGKAAVGVRAGIRGPGDGRGAGMALGAEIRAPADRPDGAGRGVGDGVAAVRLLQIAMMARFGPRRWSCCWGWRS